MGRLTTKPSYTPDNGDCGPSAWVQAAHSKCFGAGAGAPQLSREDVLKRAAALRVDTARTVRTNPFLALGKASHAQIAKDEPRLSWPSNRPPSQSELADKVVPMRADGE